MKTYIIIFFILFLALSSLFSQNIHSEKMAIETLIKKQSDLFRSRDFQAYQDVWAHEPYIVRVTQNGHWVTGWDSVSAYYKNLFDYFESQGFETQYEISNLHIQVNGNSAWAIHSQHNEGIFNNNPISTDQINTRIFEKKNGQWKIVFLSTENVSGQTMASIEQEFNTLGYRFMEMGKLDEAIKTFKLNVDFYPKSSNVYDSLGEAYMKNGNTELAIENYKKSLELDTKNDNARKMLEKLKK